MTLCFGTKFWVLQNVASRNLNGMENNMIFKVENYKQIEKELKVGAAKFKQEFAHVL